eukprot:m.358508 g.358508  ORF g.358508 m.358508 type:complete len:316 (+) comp18163_c0_seq1:754-1701(+)
MLVCKVDQAGHARVLWATVDERAAFQHSSNTVHSGWGHVFVRGFDSSNKVVSSVMNTSLNITEALCVCRPHDNDLIHLCGSLEVTDVLAQCFDVCPLVITWQHVVCTLGLVHGNVIRVVDTWVRCHVLEHGVELTLQIILKHLCTLHGITQVHATDIPATKHNVVWMHHRHHRRHWDMHVLAAGIYTKLERGCLRHAAKVVWLHRSCTSFPSKVVLVCKAATGDGSSVVATPTNDHDTQLWDTRACVEIVCRALWLSSDNPACVWLAYKHRTIFKGGSEPQAIFIVCHEGRVDLQRHRRSSRSSLGSHFSMLCAD